MGRRRRLKEIILEHKGVLGIAGAIGVTACALGGGLVLSPGEGSTPVKASAGGGENVTPSATATQVVLPPKGFLTRGATIMNAKGIQCGTLDTDKEVPLTAPMVDGAATRRVGSVEAFGPLAVNQFNVRGLSGRDACPAQIYVPLDNVEWTVK